MRQPRADKVTLIQWEKLCLILQAAKRLTGNDGQKIVVKRVQIKLCKLLRLVFFLLLPLGADQLLLFHD